ncbi:MAG: InlB B-repeat-containing protein, partial [Clostridia bacterium]|nr:InlB B-repeat-containing protein [Clostridia bacterium]
MSKIRKIVTILLTVILSLSCFSFFACDGKDDSHPQEPTVYSITYHLGGGQLPADAVSEYSLYDKDISLPTPTKAGHTFTGWNTGTEVITVIAAGTKGDLNLTATWQANSYTITFNYGEGSGTETTRGVTYGSTVTDLPVATAPAGKTFTAWKM